MREMLIGEGLIEALIADLREQIARLHRDLATMHAVWRIQEEARQRREDKITHVRGELRRARARIAELDGHIVELHAIINDRVAERLPKPKGYEHYTWPTIRAIQASTSKGKP